MHPESYQAAENLLKRFSLKEAEVKANGQILKQSIQNEDVQLAELAGDCGVGTPTLEDIIVFLNKFFQLVPEKSKIYLCRAG